MYQSMTIRFKIFWIKNNYLLKNMYRQAICAVFVNKENKFLLGFNPRDKVYKKCQWGIENGENPREACKREVKEELGIEIFDEDIIKEFEETCNYNFEDKGVIFIDGKWFVGQELKIFKINFDEEKMLFQKSDEFETFLWISSSELTNFKLSQRGDYKLRAYKKIVEIIWI